MNTTPPHGKIIQWLCAALTLFLAACATMTGLEPPDVRLTGLRLVEAKGFETTFEVDLRVLNPNKTPFNIQGIDCDLTVNDRHLADGVAKPQKEIPAYGSEIITIKVYASMLDMFGAARHIFKDAQSDTADLQATYALKGHLRLTDGTRSGKMPLDAKGEINLNELMMINPQR